MPNRCYRMPGKDMRSKEKPDRPTPFVIYLLSMFLALIVLLPATLGFFYLLDLSFFEKSHEDVVLSAMILGAGLTIAAGAVLGYFASRQIMDIKE